MAFKIIHKYFGVRIFGFFGADGFDLQALGENEVFSRWEAEKQSEEIRAF
jgi:hypothetical protein